MNDRKNYKPICYNNIHCRPIARFLSFYVAANANNISTDLSIFVRSSPGFTFIDPDVAYFTYPKYNEVARNETLQRPFAFCVCEIILLGKSYNIAWNGGSSDESCFSI